MSRCLLFVAFLMGSVAFATASASWSVSATGACATPMESAGAILLSTGDVLMVGDAAGAPPEVYDLGAESFLSLSPISTPPARAAAVRLNDGSVLAVGGFDGVAAVKTALTFDA